MASIDRKVVYKGVIFDFNGVLFLDSNLHERAWRSVAFNLAKKNLTDFEIKNYIHGRSNSEIFGWLLQRKISTRELKDFIEMKESMYRHMCLRSDGQFKLNDGAVKLFEYLKKENIVFTIATASGEKNLFFFIEHLKLRNWFDINKIIYDDGTLPGKPNPDFYLRASLLLNLEPYQCVVIEDSISGIYAARAANIGKIVGYGLEKDHKELKEEGAHQTIDSLSKFSLETVG